MFEVAWLLTGTVWVFSLDRDNQVFGVFFIIGYLSIFGFLFKCENSGILNFEDLLKQSINQSGTEFNKLPIAGFKSLLIDSLSNELPYFRIWTFEISLPAIVLKLPEYKGVT